MPTVKPRKRPDAPLTHADLVVLAMLAGGPTHGYDIIAALEKREGGGRPPVSRAQVYQCLKKLRARAMVVSARDGGPSVGPEREPCRLSASGRRALSAALRSDDWTRDRPPIPFPTWLMLLGKAPTADRAAALAARRRHLDDQIQRETIALERLRSETGADVSLAAAASTHAVEVLRVERQLIDAIEPMLGESGHEPRSG